MEKFDIVAKTLFGFEEILATELRELGAENIEVGNRAVMYKGDNALLYKSNLHLRTAIKIMKPIASFYVGDEEDLYIKVKKIQWTDYFTTDQTFAIDGTTSGEAFKHSKYVSLKTKDAIVDQFRDIYGVRPSVELEDPDFRINVHITNKRCTLSLDSSGVSLNKRGYRLVQTQAPLSETLAAGLVLLSGWDKKSDFINPMCGSGTIALEAALIARNIAPGIQRNFIFEKWNDFDSELWTKLKKEAKEQVVAFDGDIMGFDNDPEAIEISKENAQCANVGDMVSFVCMDFFKDDPNVSEGMILINPPYGERLEDKDEMVDFYKEIGTKLKHFYNGCDAWIISANFQAMKFVGLRPSKKMRLFNGPLDCRYNKYELYRGSKKASKQEKGEE